MTVLTPEERAYVQQRIVEQRVALACTEGYLQDPSLSDDEREDWETIQQTISLHLYLDLTGLRDARASEGRELA